MLFRHIKNHWPYYLLGITSIALANIIYSIYPSLLGRFTDELQQQALTRKGVIQYSVWLMLIGVGYGVLFGIGQYMNHRMGRKFEFITRESIFRQFTQLSESFHSKHGVGKLLSLFMNDVSALRETIANGVNQMTNASFLLVSVLVMMSVSQIPLYLVLICALPLFSIPFFVIYFGPRIRSRSRAVQDAIASMTESAEEQFGGIKVTKTFAMEHTAEERFGATVDAIRDNQLRLVRMTSLFQTLIPFAGAMSLAIAILYGGIQTIQGHISLGNFVMLTLYLRMLMNPLQQLGNVFNTVLRSRASLDRLNRLFDEVPDIRDSEQSLPMSEEPVALEIRNLSFTYPDTNKPSLHHINIRLEPGHTLGIVGRTGSGKTTLVKLLLRIYDPPAGTIWIGGAGNELGHDILDISLESLRTKIGYVPQDGFLFSTTIHDNIAFSDRGVDEDSVKSAARLAEVYQNIESFPEQYATKLGERGMTLSGGQRQRTSLARGLIKQAPLLILDDSVSAVDVVTETSILSNLQRARKGMTNIVIAHRISSVRHADEIVVIEEGTIVERGTHEQLLKMGGYYASLYNIQEGGMQDVGIIGQSEFTSKSQ